MTWSVRRIFQYKLYVSMLLTLNDMCQGSIYLGQYGVVCIVRYFPGNQTVTICWKMRLVILGESITQSIIYNYFIQSGIKQFLIGRHLKNLSVQ